MSFLHRMWQTPARAAVMVLAFLVVPAIEARGQAQILMNSTRQTIDGFGGSTAWHAALTDAQANTLFSNGNNQQLGLSLLRIRIDPNRFWSEETSNSQKARARGAKVMGTPWTPPASMKDNNNVVGGRLRTDQYGAYVTYLNDASNTIGLDYISLANEPDITVTYESCFWSPTEILNFFRNNAQGLNRTTVMPESFQFNDSYSDPTLNDATAVGRVGIVGGHIYGNGLYTHTNAQNKGKRVWMTEHYRDGSGNDINVAIGTAKEILDCMANNMSAYFWWWIVYPNNGTNIMSGSTALKTGYAMGQYAKWVRPGYVRVDATYNPSTNIFVTAFKGGAGDVVIVAVNTGGGSVNQAFQIQNGSAGAVTPYRTSGSENIATLGAITVTNGAFTATLPAMSVTTFVQSAGGGGGGGGGVTYNRLRNRATGLYADGMGQTTNGAALGQYANTTHVNSNWETVSQTDGYARYRNRGTSLFIDGMGRTTNGSDCGQYANTTHVNAQWAREDQGGGFYKLRNRGTGLYLDGMGRTTNGSNMGQWAGGTSFNQQFAFDAP